MGLLFLTEFERLDEQSLSTTCEMPAKFCRGISDVHKITIASDGIDPDLATRGGTPEYLFHLQVAAAEFAKRFFYPGLRR